MKPCAKLSRPMIGRAVPLEKISKRTVLLTILQRHTRFPRSVSLQRACFTRFFDRSKRPTDALSTVVVPARLIALEILSASRNADVYLSLKRYSAHLIPINIDTHTIDTPNSFQRLFKNSFNQHYKIPFFFQ